MKSRKKVSGGVNTAVNRCDKRMAWKGGLPAHTTVEDKDKIERNAGRGSSEKTAHLLAKHANVVDSKSKTVKKMPLNSVKENLANREFVRRNILTKGAIIEVQTDSGPRTAKVTNRPGQNGFVQAVLLEETK